MRTFFSKKKYGKMVRCIICKVELQYSSKDGSTSSMKKHLQRRHPSVLVEAAANDSTSGSKPSTSRASVSNQPTWLNMLKNKDKLSSDSVRANIFN